MDTLSGVETADKGVRRARAQDSARGLSLHVRLTLLVAGTLLPMLLLLGVMVYQSYDRARQTASDRVLQTTRSALASVEREVENQIAALEVLALSPALQAGNYQGFAEDAVRFLSRYPPGTAISISDSTGQILFSTNASTNLALPKRGDSEAVAAIFGTARPYVSNIYVGRISNRPIITVDVPVMRDGQVLYAMALNSPRSVFFDILKNLGLPDGWVVSILDRNAHHIARQPALPGEGITSAAESLKDVLDLGADNRIVETVSLEGTRVLTAFSRSAEIGWIVAIGMPLDALSTPTRQTIVTALVLGVILMLVGLLFAARLARQIIRGQAHRDMLANELNHRVKNTLASVLGIVTRGLQGSPAAEATKKAIEARLMALSHAHDILSSENWEDADMRELANAIIEPHLLEAGRGFRSGGARLHGPEVRLKPRVAIAIAMVLNELVTNAVKHGALSTPEGTIDLTWRPTGAGRLHLEWRESGGPAVKAPDRTGYGTRFIERAVTNELNGTCAMSYVAAGLICTCDISLENAIVWI